MKDLAQNKVFYKTLIASDGIAVTIKHLKDFIPSASSKYEDLLLIEARQNETNKKRLRDVLSDQELQIAYNKIREDLMVLIDGLVPEDFDTSQASSRHSGSKKARRGHILHRIPSKMQCTKETRCVVRIALDEDTIIENIDWDEHVKLESVRVSDLMQVELIDPSEEQPFSIRTISTPEQFIDEDDYTEWQFFIKPLKAGTFPLVLKVAVIELVYGKERKREIVLEQTVNIVTEEAKIPREQGLQPAGVQLDFGATSRVPDEENTANSSSPSMRAFRGSLAKRGALICRFA